MAATRGVVYCPEAASRSVVGFLQHAWKQHALEVVPIYVSNKLMLDKCHNVSCSNTTPCHFEFSSACPAAHSFACSPKLARLGAALFSYPRQSVHHFLKQHDQSHIPINRGAGQD
jgi:hypothetical protein